MSQRPLTSWVAGALAACAIFLGGENLARGGTIKGDIYFTTFYGSNGYGPSKDRLHHVGYTYDESTHTLKVGTVKPIPTTKAIGADGLLFAPDGKTLLVGGQDHYVYHVDPSNGKVLQALPTGGLSDYHLALDPNGKTVYGGGTEGGSSGLAIVPLYGNGKTVSVSGSNSSITGLAFDKNGNGYYTSSGAGGDGNFGTITHLDGSPHTKALLTNLPAAHGISYDSFTGDFILVGSNEIAQVDGSGHIVSHKFFSGYGA
jgi:DNA-binding beta-propeller fold protein YncE